LTNWYIRRSRRRFWHEEASVDRDQAFATLYHVLVQLSKIAAPYVPFISEAIYSNLRTVDMPDSVHLCDFPEYHSERRNESLEQAMAAVQTTVSLGHALRKEHKLKVRQPLPAVHLASGCPQVLDFLRSQHHLISEELNVKDVFLSDDEQRFVSLKAKPNFRVLGKKVGKLMRQVQQAIDAFHHDQLAELLDGKNVELTIEGERIAITPEDVQVDRLVRDGLIAANAGHITIALDTALSEELLIEGLARELVNKINTMRREAGFAVTDRINITIDATERVRRSFEIFGPMIAGEVLAVSVNFGSCQGTLWDLNGESVSIALTKV
jgi:isoleucyl-tRNA synthetase